MEYKSEKRICQNCQKDFVIEPDDFGFYKKIKVSPPTFCPECRRQRRWAWRNNMSLYSRKCDLCGKSVVSLYSPDSGFVIYCNKCWWSDKWDSKSYAVDYDFLKPFFNQLNDLLHKVPQMSVVNDDGIASLNCEYTHDWWFSKNCYMCFSGWYVENVMYSYFILAGRDIVDSLIIRSKSERLYECYMTSNCYNVKYSKEEYKKILESYRLDTFSGVEKAQIEYDQFILSYPRRYVFVFRSPGSTGDIISDSKNSRNSFVIKNTENVRYSDFVGDNSATTKDSYDITTTGGVSESYECAVGDHSQLNLFGLFSVKSQDIKYCQHCHNCKHCFGCVGLRNANYCIFNKQYTKEE